MKTCFASIVTMMAFLLFSCQESTTSSNKENKDTVYSGLEGTREDASQLSNSTIDTSSGKSSKETAKVDSTSKIKKDSISH
jgi:hypothetical protein